MASAAGFVWVELKKFQVACRERLPEKYCAVCLGFGQGGFELFEAVPGLGFELRLAQEDGRVGDGESGGVADELFEQPAAGGIVEAVAEQEDGLRLYPGEFLADKGGAAHLFFGGGFEGDARCAAQPGGAKNLFGRQADSSEHIVKQPAVPAADELAGFVVAGGGVEADHHEAGGHGAVAAEGLFALTVQGTGGTGGGLPLQFFGAGEGGVGQCRPQPLHGGERVAFIFGRHGGGLERLGGGDGGQHVGTVALRGRGGAGGGLVGREGAGWMLLKPAGLVLLKPALFIFR